jgi:hypothetical protein
MQKLAGFFANNKMYFNTRTVVFPDKEILAAMPFGKWVYKAYNQMTAYCHETRARHPTAIESLSFFWELNIIFVQDALATMVLHPEWQFHPLFTELDVFEMEAFQVSSTDAY